MQTEKLPKLNRYFIQEFLRFQGLRVDELECFVIRKINVWAHGQGGAKSVCADGAG